MARKQARLPGKKDVTRALLLKGSVFVHLDPRCDDVVVPADFKKQPQLVVQVGLDMPVPIPDLRVDASGVHGTLSFQRNPFTCTVPWAAVFAVVGDDGRGMVWPTSMPKEIAVEVEREARRAKLTTAGQVAVAGPNGNVRRVRRTRADEDEIGVAKLPSERRSDAARKQPLRAVQMAAPASTPTRVREPDTRTTRRGRPLPPYLRLVK